jgi:hypothetical protein
MSPFNCSFMPKIIMKFVDSILYIYETFFFFLAFQNICRQLIEIKFKQKLSIYSLLLTLSLFWHMQKKATSVMVIGVVE